MKTSIYDPCNDYDIDHTFKGSWNNKSIGCFFIQANLSEVYHIFNQDFISDEKQVLRLLDNPLDESYFYFWISRDFSRFYQSFSAFPYSGMNDMKSRYIKFKPIELQSIEDIKYIDLEKI